MVRFRFNVIRSLLFYFNFVEFSSQLDFFELFFTKEFGENITLESNRQFTYLKEQDTEFMKKNKHPKEVTLNEMYTFFGLSLLMTRCKKLRLHEYWSTDPLLSTPIFTTIMKRDRYFFILKILHFCDNKQSPDGDKLYKIRYVVDYLRNTFKDIFTPSEKLCIDESLVLFKGRLSFRQYIPSKRHRFGVKLFMLCDCKIGYCLDFIVYTGTSTDVEKLSQRDEVVGKSGQIVMTLMRPYLNNNHTLYLDNWYNSPSLAQLLYHNKTNCCGTVRKNRQSMPNFSQKLRPGEMTFRSSGPILVVKWCAKREIHMITTRNDFGMSSTGKKDRKTHLQILKPNSVLDYNQNMGSVDKTDMLISSVESVRKSVKWYKKLFFHFLDICIINSHALYKEVTKRRSSIADFQLEVARKLIAKYCTADVTANSRHSSKEHPLRLTARHFVSKVPKPDERKSRPAVRRCVVCSKKGKRSDTTYQCSVCDVGLCVLPCFETYHTKNKF